MTGCHQSKYRRTTMQAKSFYGWKLLAVIWCILFVNLAFPAVGSSVINASMATDLQMDRKTLGLLFSVFLMMTGLPAPFVAVFVNKYGARVILIAGSIGLMIGCILMATVVNSGIVAVIVFGVVVGSGVMGGGLLATQVCVAHWFVKRRAMALSILHSAGSIGGIISAPLLSYVIISNDNNWRFGWWLIVGLVVVSTLLAVVFVRNKPSDLGQIADGGTEPVQDTGGEHAPGKVYISKEEWTFRAALRSPSLWLLMLCSLGMSGGYALFMGHGVVYLQDLGHSPTRAALAISVLVFGDLMGKIFVGIFGDRIEPRYLWSGVMFVFSLGLVLAVSAYNTIIIYTFAICLGIGFGGSVVLMMAVLANYYGSTAFASISGVALAIQTTVSAIVPVLGGYYYDTHGSYAPSFYSMAVLCFCGALLLIFVRPPRKMDEPSPVPAQDVQLSGEQAE